MENNILYCGSAKRNITPKNEWLPGLYGIMHKRIYSVHDDIYLRVIAFSNKIEKALIVSYDLDKATRPEENVELLSKTYSIPKENILYFGIHTHTAPCTGPRKPFEQPPDENAEKGTLQYEAFLQKNLLECAKEALDSMVEVRVGFGTGPSYININRNQLFHYTAEDGMQYDYFGLGMNPTAEVDRTASLIRMEDTNGNPVAFFMNYAVHNVAMIANDADGKGNIAISADIGGNVSKYMEENYGGVAVWSSGAAGDVNPIMMNQFYYPDPATGKRVEHVAPGMAAAEAALVMMATRHFDDIKLINQRIKCQEIDHTIKGSFYTVQTPMLEKAGTYEILFQTLRVGDMIFVGCSGELYGSLGKLIKEETGFEKTCVINHNLSLLVDSGYIYDDETTLSYNENCPVNGGIPMGGKGKSKIGTIKPAIKECIKEMMNHVK